MAAWGVDAPERKRHLGTVLGPCWAFFANRNLGRQTGGVPWAGQVLNGVVKHIAHVAFVPSAVGTGTTEQNPLDKMLCLSPHVKGLPGRD